MKKSILSLILCLLVFISCTQDSDANEELRLTNSTDVYIAGVENNKACYWKNGIIHTLIGGDSIIPFKIIVENGDVYVFGTEQTPDYVKYYFWKNNVKNDISQYINIPYSNNYNNTSFKIIDFEVNGGNIFILGEVRSPLSMLPGGSYDYDTEFCYWKNGVKNIIYTDSSTTVDYAIIRNFAIYNNDVYIPILKPSNNTFDTPFELGYFKNSTYHLLTPASSNSYASRKIYSNSTGVYLSMFNVNSNISFYKNLVTGVESYQSSTIKNKFTMDGNNFYDFSDWDNYYYKNDILIQNPTQQDYKYTIDMKVLNQNKYQIRFNRINDQIIAYKVFINDVETQNILASQGSFNSIFVE